ncbi:MAG: radical SAM protein [Methanomassiliicoccales archaeon]|nr:radical SAM protein [Methanomassiliicoccales archaeon]
MKDPLERYYRILEGNEKALYLLLRENESDFDSESCDDDLWSLHEDEMKTFWSHVSDGSGTVGTKPIEGRSLLDLKAELARRMMRRCEICEWKCSVDRTAGQEGRCGVLDARISSEFLHYGEEPQLIPSYTIFFSGCNFKCAFCQNYDISTDPGNGLLVPATRLADMIERRASGSETSPSVQATGRVRGRAVNVNWVGGDPTPNLAYILDVLRISSADIPQIWNSNMYLSEKSMRLLEGVIDIYLTDLKYGNDSCAKRLSGIPDYMRIVSRNHVLAAKHAEVIVRHLVLPNHVECCSIPAMNWLSKNTPEALVNVMDQYRPMHRAFEHEDISRGVRDEEYERVRDHAESLGLRLV